MDIEKILKQMTLKDKIALCTGADFWHSKAMEQYGIPAFTMSDGPHGLRCQYGETDMIGINNSLPATCFPAAVTAGAAWNPELYAAMGAAIGEEALSQKVDVVLGPGCNIKRNPLCGRNFEYISEDPYLAGWLAAAFIRGLQGAGVSASLKHFALNNQEYKRQNGDSQVDDRAMRELYLAPFEIAVKEGKPDTVMCSYPKINGVHASDNHWLLTQILRLEWGFDGMVVTDWGALNNRIKGFQAGCDLNMPGDSKFMEKAALEAVKNGVLDEKDVDTSVRRILRLAFSAQKRIKGGSFDADAHHALACRVAEEGAVLLKNDGKILPLKESQSAAIIGYMARKMRYQGSGSSHINPTKVINPVDAMPNLPFASGYDEQGDTTDALILEAVALAKQVEVPIVFTGLPDRYESEGFDRENMRMPEGHLRLIEAVAEANPDTVVVLLGGAPMECPWADKVRAILFLGLPGQAGGEACANLLTGRAVPGGKLTESWPISYVDVISRETFGQRNTEYRESMYVGYRYYDKAKKTVRWPFGYGLSYTTFSYSDLKTEGKTVTVTVSNTGAATGAEVVQLYVRPPQDGVHRPVRELKGFRKVLLQPGENKTVSFVLDDRSFALWQDGWKIPAGIYGVEVGGLTADIHVEGEALPAPDWQAGSWYETMEGAPTRQEWETAMGHPVPVTPGPRKGQFTLDNTCMEMKDHSFIMKVQYKVTEHIIAKSFGGKKNWSDPSYKMMITCAVDCPLRATVISSGGAMSDRLALGMLEMANGHFFRGIRKMIKG